MFRRIIGLAFGLYGGWQFWGIHKALNAYVTRGADFQTSLMEPEFLLPGAASLLIAIGGIIMLLGTRFGLALATLGVVIFCVFTAAIVSAGADSSLWMNKAIAAGILAVGVIIAFRLPRKSDG